MKHRLSAYIAIGSAALFMLASITGAVPREYYSALMPALIVSSLFFVALLAYSAWRLSLISHGFKKAAAAASGGFGAFLAYLSATDESFRRARILLVPLAAALFITAVIAALLVRLNSTRRSGAKRRGRR